MQARLFVISMLLTGCATPPESTEAIDPLDDRDASVAIEWMPAQGHVALSPASWQFVIPTARADGARERRVAIPSAVPRQCPKYTRSR